MVSNSERMKDHLEVSELGACSCCDLNGEKSVLNSRAFREIREIFRRRWGIALSFSRAWEDGACGRKSGVCGLCDYVTKSEHLRASCQQSVHAGRRLVGDSTEGVGASYSCHAGLTKIIVPVKHGGKLAGYVETGPGGFLAVEPGSPQWKEICAFLGEHLDNLPHADSLLRSLPLETDDLLDQALQLARLAALSIEDWLVSSSRPAATVPAERSQADATTSMRERRESSTETEVAPDAGLGSELGRIRRTLEKCGGNRNQAALELGMSRATLFRRLRKYGITGNDRGTRSVAGTIPSEG